MSACSTESGEPRKMLWLPTQSTTNKTVATESFVGNVDRKPQRRDNGTGESGGSFTSKKLEAMPAAKKRRLLTNPKPLMRKKTVAESVCASERRTSRTAVRCGLIRSKINGLPNEIIPGRKSRSTGPKQLPGFINP